MSRMEKFLTPHLGEPMAYMTPEKIANIINYAKSNYIQGPCSKRYNFHKELKDLNAVFRFWMDHYDFKFTNPVRSFHAQIAVMEDIPEKDRKISMEETMKFFKALEKSTIYQDMAIMQFFCGSRIGETVGIQIKNIDFENRVLRIKDVITWVKGVPRIKTCPKNGKSREVFINDTILDIITRRLKDVPKNCPFLFHDDGEALRYNRINVAFNEAWEKAGLSGKFSVSHLLRYSGAQCARKVTGSLEAAAAVTGHQDMKMAAHYGKLDSVDLNQSSVIQMEKYMKQLSNSETGPLAA
jgi:integrase